MEKGVSAPGARISHVLSETYPRSITADQLAVLLNRVALFHLRIPHVHSCSAEGVETFFFYSPRCKVKYFIDEIMDLRELETRLELKIPAGAGKCTPRSGLFVPLFPGT